MLGRVPRRGEPAQSEAAEVDLFAVGDASHREAVTGCARVRAARRRLRRARGAGHEVGVEVGLGREGDVETSAFGLREVTAWVAGGVDDEGPTGAEIDEVGGVARPSSTNAIGSGLLRVRFVTIPSLPARDRVRPSCLPSTTIVKYSFEYLTAMACGCSMQRRG